MKNPKILIFSTAYYPFVGGAEVAIKEITDRVFGIDFDLITAKFDKNLPKFERIDNVNVYRIGFGIPILDKMLLPFWGAIKTIKLSSKKHYKYFWGMMISFGSGAAFVANILRFWKPTPIILTLQEGDSESHLIHRWYGIINLAWKLALNNTFIVTVISTYLEKRARRLGYKGKIKIIPNGVDIKKFDFDLSEEERKNIRTNLNLDYKDTALITASRLTKKNGIEDVLYAMKFLPENFKFIICGVGELEEDLKSKVESLKLENRIVFKGFVSHNDLPKYLKSCDIFIRSSLSEGMGNSFIEAMAAKIPVIATPVGGITDFLMDSSDTLDQHVTGYFCKPQNPESIAETAKRVVADMNKNVVIENAYKMVSEKYSWDLIAQKMREVFKT